jgi:hypothetical protein
MKAVLLVSALVGALALTGCEKAADVASRNISLAADNFEINRRIVFYNGIGGEYILTIEGRCSLGNNDSYGKLSVTCRTGHNAYKKHFLGLSDNVTFFAEQIETADVSTYHYRVMFRPQTILPDVDFDADGGEVLRNRN